MTELELLIDFHVDAERQGPGSYSDTYVDLFSEFLSKVT